MVDYKISSFLYLCSGNHGSSALGEATVQERSFLKEFAGFVLFGSDICENREEDDS